VRWKERGHDPVTRRTVFPALKPKDSRAAELVFDGRTGRVAMWSSSQSGRKRRLLAFIDIAVAWRKLRGSGLVADRSASRGSTP